MTEGAAYFWDGARMHTLVIEEDQSFHDELRKRGYMGMWCLDTRFKHEPGMYRDKTSDRYGRMRDYGWQGKSFNAFPKKFKTHLLILGVI